MAFVSRRTVLIGGAAMAASPMLGRARAADMAMVTMNGDQFGAEVWFDPAGLLVHPGATITWRNNDPGNSHSTTAFHPANRGHPLRIPAAAEPWNSDYLLPGEEFSVMLTVPGVYDYFCIPHEAAGMVGRIVVADGATAPESSAPDAPGFVAVEEIMRLALCTARPPRPAWPEAITDELPSCPQSI